MTSSKYRVRELVQEDRRALDTFVGNSPQGDVMQSWEWGLVKSQGGDWRPLRFGVFDNSGALVASISILIRKLPIIGNFYYAPRGPILRDWQDREPIGLLLESVRGRARQDSAAFLKIDPAVTMQTAGAVQRMKELDFQSPADFDSQGFGGTQPRTVMALDIGEKSMDELLMACKPQCRRNIRICQKKGVEVILETIREDLAAFYDLLKVTAMRDGFRVRGCNYYETLWDELVPHGMGQLFLTRYEGQYLSGAFCFVIGDKCVYVYGASSNEHRNVMPNYGMQWAMIGWAKDHGCVLYDFRGVSPKKPTEPGALDEADKDDHLQGLNRFKEGFGARYIEYIGELDLVYNKAAYWLWTTAKPTAQSVLRKIRK